MSETPPEPSHELVPYVHMSPAHPLWNDWIELVFARFKF